MTPKDKKVERAKLALENKKRCSACNLVKDYKNYTRDKSKTDNYAHNCNPCRAKVSRITSRKRRERNINVRFIDAIRSRLSHAIKASGYKKDTKTYELLGCEGEFLKKHLKRHFTKGMSFKNYGKWHIDHHIPLSSAKSLKELKSLAHYSNLRPMWAKDNHSKYNKGLGQQYSLLIKDTIY